MRVIRRHSIAVSFLVLTAAAPPAPPWSVFGLELDQPLAIPMCAKKILPNGQPSQFVYQNDPAETCYEPDIQLSDAPFRRGTVNFPLQHMPLILSLNSGYTFIIDGKLAGLRFNTLDHTVTSGVLNELTAKFGNPSSVTRVTAGPSGIALPAIHTEWRLPGLYVSYRNIDKSVRYGVLQIDTPAMLAQREQDERARANARTAL